MRGINGISKGEEVVDVFRKGKFELLALTETNKAERKCEGFMVKYVNCGIMHVQSSVGKG